MSLWVQRKSLIREGSRPPFEQPYRDARAEHVQREEDPQETQHGGYPARPKR
jgi:hypothetical protein